MDNQVTQSFGTQSEQQTEKKCSVCGTVLTSTDAFCPTCGSMVKISVPQPTNKLASIFNDKKKLIIGAAIAIIAVVLICVLIPVISGNSVKEEDIIGVWGSETNDSWILLEISEGGECGMILTSKYDGDLEFHEGTWKIDGKKVICEMEKSSGGSLTFEFTYEDGELVTPNAVFTRQDLD